MQQQWNACSELGLAGVGGWGVQHLVGVLRGKSHKEGECCEVVFREQSGKGPLEQNRGDSDT